MSKSLVEQAFDRNLLFPPWILVLVKNFSFKEQFLSYCSSQISKIDPIISWQDLKSFFLSNNWNWNEFIQSNLPTILFESGYLLSSDIQASDIPIDDMNKLFLICSEFQSSKAVFDLEMLESLSSIPSQSPVQEDKENNVSNPNLSQYYSLSSTSLSQTYEIKTSFGVIFSTNFSRIFAGISANSFQEHIKSQFSLLHQTLISNNQDTKNRPKYPRTSLEIELNQRIFITGIVTQTDLTSTHLYSTKLQLENFLLNCTIIVSISKNQQSNIPLGIVLGIVGKVNDLENLSANKLKITISAESWFLPGINPPSKKPTPKAINESWVALIGSIDFSNPSFANNLLNHFVKWLHTSHENFRIGYCMFNGGILTSDDIKFPIDSDSDDNEQFNSPKSIYSYFNTIIGKIPKNIKIFIVPSNFDITNQFLPQPPILSDYQSKKENIYYLENPNLVTIEDKNLLLYNPYHFFSLDPFIDQPEKFTIELLNYRHLSPIWEKDNYIFPYIQDLLVIPDDIDFFIFHHPTQSILSNYKNINLLGIASNKNDSLKEFPVLIFNLHTLERKIVSIPLT